MFGYSLVEQGEPWLIWAEVKLYEGGQSSLVVLCCIAPAATLGLQLSLALHWEFPASLSCVEHVWGLRVQWAYGARRGSEKETFTEQRQDMMQAGGCRQLQAKIQVQADVAWTQWHMETTWQTTGVSGPVLGGWLGGNDGAGVPVGVKTRWVGRWESWRASVWWVGNEKDWNVLCKWKDLGDVRMAKRQNMFSLQLPSFECKRTSAVSSENITNKN